MQSPAPGNASSAAARRPPPIFQIGFNKCGTASLYYFLLHSGLRSHHWLKGLLAKGIANRMDAGEDPIMDFPTGIGFTDMMAFGARKMIEPYKRFDYLHRWYPRALFLLNTRDREKWIASRSAHEAGGIRLIANYARLLRISEAQVPDYWRAEWDVHHAAVRAFFAGAPNFLEYDIERDDPQKLIAFIARRYPQCRDTPLDVHNATQPAPTAKAGV